MINSTDTFVFRRIHPVSQRVSNGRATVQELVDLVGSSITLPPISFPTQAQNTFFAAPDGSSGDPSFRVIALNDIPTITYSKFQDVGPNSVLARSSATTGDVGEISLSTSQLFGRGETGNLTPIDLGTNLSMSGTTLNAAGGAPATYFNPYIF